VSLTVTGPGGSNTTIKTDYIQILPSVTTSVTGGSYTTAQTVTLTCDDPTATIYYTNDTTDPRHSTPRIQYTEPFTLDSTNTVRYAAITGTGLWSPLYIQNYVIGTGGLLDSPSSTYQINNNHTGQSEYEGPQSNATKWNITDMTFFQDSVWL
jgi:PKD repeat protein